MSLSWDFYIFFLFINDLDILLPQLLNDRKEQNSTKENEIRILQINP